jgi:hypothetical protein
VVDQARHGRRAEAVVDVHDGHPAGTGVQHAQQGGDPPETGAVADAGGDGAKKILFSASNPSGSLEISKSISISEKTFSTKYIIVTPFFHPAIQSF